MSEIAATAGGEALRPLAPVHVTARREADGIRIACIRRTRRDGDAWEPVEVPLGEDGERYEVDILAGAAVLRTLATAVRAGALSGGAGARRFRRRAEFALA